jgi:hypothetical protein
MEWTAERPLNKGDRMDCVDFIDDEEKFFAESVVINASGVRDIIGFVNVSEMVYIELPIPEESNIPTEQHTMFEYVYHVASEYRRVFDLGNKKLIVVVPASRPLLSIGIVTAIIQIAEHPMVVTVDERGQVAVAWNMKWLQTLCRNRQRKERKRTGMFVCPSGGGE